MEKKKSSKEFSISEVVIDPQKIQPIIATFQNGQLKEESASNLQYKLYNDKTSKTILAVSDDRMVYKGSKPDPEKELLNTMIGIYNKKTGKVRLVSCEHWELAPVLGKITQTRTDFHDGAIAALSKEFGSKKVKRRTEQYEKMQIDIDSVKEKLESIVADIEVKNNDIGTEVNDDFTSTMVPLCNREATTIFDVYNVYEIIPKEHIKSLYEYVEHVLANGFDDSRNNYFSDFLNVIEKGTKTNKKVAILIYLRAICKWLEVPVVKARRIDFTRDTYNLPYEVASHLVNTYTIPSQNARQRPPIMKDKAVLHCILLILMVNNYTIDLDQFAKAINIRMSVKKLTEFAKLLCLTSQKDKSIYSLKLPLPAQPPPAVKKRGRKK